MSKVVWGALMLVLGIFVGAVVVPPLLPAGAEQWVEDRQAQLPGASVSAPVGADGRLNKRVAQADSRSVSDAVLSAIASADMPSLRGQFVREALAVDALAFSNLVAQTQGELVHQDTISSTCFDGVRPYCIIVTRASLVSAQAQTFYLSTSVEFVDGAWKATSFSWSALRPTPVPTEDPNRQQIVY